MEILTRKPGPQYFPESKMKTIIIIIILYCCFLIWTNRSNYFQSRYPALNYASNSNIFFGNMKETVLLSPLLKHALDRTRFDVPSSGCRFDLLDLISWVGIALPQLYCWFEIFFMNMKCICIEIYKASEYI